MKIKMLLENQSAVEGIMCAHGLSIYIETAHHKIMMDAGPDWRFARNAVKMGVDISAVDTLVLSHGHYDHAGGLSEFMRLNDRARIYAAKGYDMPHYNEMGSYIGVEPVLIGHPRITVLDGDLKIDDEISILGFRNEKAVRDAGTAGMTVGRIDGFKRVTIEPETFAHEHCLLVSDAGKCALFSGCSHKGIINIANWASKYTPDAIVGGFHLKGVKPENFSSLDSVAQELLKFPVVYYTGHCTGAEQYEYLKTKMGDQIRYAAAGYEFEI